MNDDCKSNVSLPRQIVRNCKKPDDLKIGKSLQILNKSFISNL